MSDELSDDAGEEWHDEFWTNNLRRPTISEACREWRRRAEALIEQEKAVRIRVEQMYQTLTESIEKLREENTFWIKNAANLQDSIETVRRNAFEAGNKSGYDSGLSLRYPQTYRSIPVDQAYRAYTEAVKEGKK